MEENRTRLPIQNETKKSKKGVKAFILASMLVLLLGTFYTAYSMYQLQVDRYEATTSFQRKEIDELRQLLYQEQNISIDKEDNYISFTEDTVPFTFEYPSNWSTETSEPLDGNFPEPDKYSITLLRPGSDVRVGRIGSSFVSKGSKIKVSVSRSSWTDVNERFTGLYQNAKNREQMKIDGLSAVRYEFGYENDPGIYTDLLKDGKLYSIQFFSDKKNESEHTAYSRYEKLVESFMFN